MSWKIDITARDEHDQDQTRDAGQERAGEEPDVTDLGVERPRQKARHRAAQRDHRLRQADGRKLAARSAECGRIGRMCVQDRLDVGPRAVGGEVQLGLPGRLLRPFHGHEPDLPVADHDALVVDEQVRDLLADSKATRAPRQSVPVPVLEGTPA